MYQKCPTCKSKGLFKKEICPTCLGERIIHKENGLPPSKYTIVPTFTPVYPWYNPTYIGESTGISITAPNTIATLT